MRYGGVMLIVAVAVTWLVGCAGENTSPLPTSSLVLFHYDATRDVVIATTAPSVQTQPINPQGYANALATRPEVSYSLAPSERLATPEATVAGTAVTANYREATGMEALSAAQSTAVMAGLEAWWWVPTVNEVRVRANGQPLRTVGPVALSDPLTHEYHTYVVNPATGEVGYLVGGLNPTSLDQAVTLINQRAVREFPATQGFLPLLVPELTLTAETGSITNGVLNVDLAGNAPRDPARLAGMVLMLTQFPQVDAVQFTFNRNYVSEPLMRGNLGRPITPYDLLLPATAAQATAEAADAMREAAAAALGRPPVEYGPALVWDTWAVVTAVPVAGAAPLTVLLEQTAAGQYQVRRFASSLNCDQAIVQGVPEHAAIAFRLPGWEKLVVEEELRVARKTQG